MKIEEAIKQNVFQSTRQKAIINLLYTANWVLNKQHDFFSPFGITVQQFNILRILRGQHPKSISATEVKSRMIDKNSDVSRLLDRLALKNLISKTTCPSDKRATDVRITEEGLELLNKLGTEQETIDSFLELTDEEASLLSDLLDRARK